MPITDVSLSARIVNEMTAQKGAPADPTKLKEMADAIAKAVVDEIKQGAVVTTTVTGSSASGGPVTGAGVGTIA